MWNSPKNRNLQLTPKQIIALVYQVEEDFCFYNDGVTDDFPVFMTNVPSFHGLHPGAVIVKAVDILHTLISPEPAPRDGHSALEEGILYGLLTTSISIARDSEQDCTKKEFKECYLDGINELLKAAGLKPVKTLKNFEDDDIEDLADALFFWDRDWELINTKMPASVKEQMGISDDYYDSQMRCPDKIDLETAWEMLRGLIDGVEAKKVSKVS